MLIFGVVLLGILAICLAVTMPSDLEFHDTDLPPNTVPVISNEQSDRPPLPTGGDIVIKRNLTNSTSRKKPLRSSEVGIEVKLLRDMAIQRKIQEYDSINSLLKAERGAFKRKMSENVDTGSHSKEVHEDVKLKNIVETFVRSEDYEDFVIDMEIHDAVRQLREEKGYKNRPNTLFDELFKRAEKEFIGDDEEELRLIRRVGEELEKRARDTINERKRIQGQELTEPKKLLADELLKLDFSGSGDSESDDVSFVPENKKEEEEGDVVEIRKTEL